MRLMALVAGLSLAAPVLAADIVLHFKHARPGVLNVALYRAADGLNAERAFFETRQSTTSHGSRVTLLAVPPGQYAIKAFLDENANGQLDRNMIGIPVEPYGFSNNARSLTGIPATAKAAFDVGDAGAEQTIELK